MVIRETSETANADQGGLWFSGQSVQTQTQILILGFGVSLIVDWPVCGSRGGDILFPNAGQRLCFHPKPVLLKLIRVWYYRWWFMRLVMLKHAVSSTRTGCNTFIHFNFNYSRDNSQPSNGFKYKFGKTTISMMFHTWLLTNNRRTEHTMLLSKKVRFLWPWYISSSHGSRNAYPIHHYSVSVDFIMYPVIYTDWILVKKDWLSVCVSVGNPLLHALLD